MATEISVPRIVIEGVWPEIDGGRYPVKREVGQSMEVWADIFKEGHEVIAGLVRYRQRSESEWHDAPMAYADNDRWKGYFPLEEVGRYVYTVEAYTDTYASWLQDMVKKFDAGQEVASDLLEGAVIVEQTAARADGRDRERLQQMLQQWRGAADQNEAVAIARSEEMNLLAKTYPDRATATRYDRELEVLVDRVRARYAAWYEFFPRSAGQDPTRGSTFREAEARLPDIAELGFDVVYFPPIHPIGRTNRKGPNNTLIARPGDPGCPYAIGNEHGGHKAVEPELGTLDDFRHFVQACEAMGMEVALDFAIQCSPDHPYVSEHPEWFYKRPDGTIKYAENPPKKYEDIYPLNFYNENWRALWEEMKSIILFWIEQGVRTFRVDNPHTKPVYFWQWLIGEVQAEHPGTIFLSEAFTRPKMMKALAKAGFTQSYSYFTWRNFKGEITEYFEELTQSEASEYLRANLFTNTPDILPLILQEGGRPAFMIRVALAATLSSVYGIYSGYELCENEAIPGKEEYLNSEKYDYKVWDWDRPGNIKDYIRRLNEIRSENPALHLYKNLRFYQSDDDNIIFYGKFAPEADNYVLVAVNLDPYQKHGTTIHVPIDALGLGPDDTYQVDEQLTGARYLWRGSAQWVELDPQVDPAHIYVVKHWQRKDYDSPCF